MMSGGSKGNVAPKVDGYNILERIGSGSYSVVYKATSKVRFKPCIIRRNVSVLSLLNNILFKTE